MEAQAIQDSLDTEQSVQLSPGEIRLETGIVARTGTSIFGAGRGVTRLVLDDGANEHVIRGAGVQGFTLADLTIDANSDSQSRDGIHAVRFDRSSDITIANVDILRPRHYGIGLQVGAGISSFHRIRISGVTIRDSGGDGIDVKNRWNGPDPRHNRSIMISDTVVINPGIRVQRQAGIDLRGPCTLSGIHVLGLRGNSTGIRFRPDGGPNGPGATWSALDNFYVEGDNEASSRTRGLTTNSIGVKISNGSILDVWAGLVVNPGSLRTVIRGVSTEGSGFAINKERGSDLRARDTTLIGCNGASLDDRGEGTELVACRFET